MDDVGLDRQIVVNEIGGLRVVRVYAPYLGRREYDCVGTVLLEPNLNRDLIAQVQHRAIGLERFVPGSLQKPDDCGTDIPLWPATQICVGASEVLLTQILYL